MIVQGQSCVTVPLPTRGADTWVRPYIFSNIEIDSM